jgi:hypothetical protein
MFLKKLQTITLKLKNIEKEIYKVPKTDENLVNFYLNNIHFSLKKIGLFKKAAFIEAQK